MKKLDELKEFELVAKALGITGFAAQDHHGYYFCTPSNPEVYRSEPVIYRWLDDDGDSFRLMVQLHIDAGLCAGVEDARQVVFNDAVAQGLSIKEAEEFVEPTADEAELRDWRNVFGHLGTPDEVGNEWHELSRKLDVANKTVAQLIEANNDKAVQIDHLKCIRFAHFNNEDCWIYQGKDDNLDSLVCPVVISPKALAALEKCAEVLGKYDGSRAIDQWDEDCCASREWEKAQYLAIKVLRK